jgi:methionine-rich copper-binding protein CopC
MEGPLSNTKEVLVMKKSFGLSILVLMLVLKLVAFSSAEDTTAPTVRSTSPAAGATGIAVNTAITASFSEAMDSGTITANTFTLRRFWGFPINGVVTYFLGRAKFDPNTDLAYNATYTATITTGVKDLAGNAMAANKTWSFTTAPKPDTTAPTVTSTRPADSTTNVALNASISATFSEAMNSSTITATSFTLKDSGNNPVSGAATYSGTTAVFRPASRLIGGTVYTATITTNAKDLAGNALATDKT